MLKTFLVEDEVVIREMIKKMIPWEQYGFELAGEAADGEMALPLILKSKPDLLITDIKMPFMDGLTLCRLVKKELPDIRIVILSGYDDFNYAKQAISIGVEDYLLKPITKNAFIERLEEIHDNRSKTDTGNTVTITAGSIEELVQKINDQAQLFLSDSVQTEEEKYVGQKFDFSV